MSAKQLQTHQTVLVLLSLWQVGRGHTDITHQHYILLHAQVNVLYKESDLQETLLERLSQNIWDCRADPRGHGQLMLLKAPGASHSNSIPLFLCSAGNAIYSLHHKFKSGPLHCWRLQCTL